MALSDTAREVCGRPDRHLYKLFLHPAETAHRTTKINPPQLNGIVKRVHRNLLADHFLAEGLRTRHETIYEMQVLRDKYLLNLRRKRPHQGPEMTRSTPRQESGDD